MNAAATATLLNAKKTKFLTDISPPAKIGAQIFKDYRCYPQYQIPSQGIGRRNRTAQVEPSSQ
jgi:hypothetical protein